MKLKTNLKKFEAQITFEPSEVAILTNILEAIQFNLPYLQMMTVTELLEKFSVFNKNIELAEIEEIED